MWHLKIIWNSNFRAHKWSLLGHSHVYSFTYCFKLILCSSCKMSHWNKDCDCMSTIWKYLHMAFTGKLHLWCVVGRSWKQPFKIDTLYFNTYQNIVSESEVQNNLNSFSMSPILCTYYWQINSPTMLFSCHPCS